MEKEIKEYLIHCKTHRNLDHKTIKAYDIDLKQFCQKIKSKLGKTPITSKLTRDHINLYISSLSNFAIRTTRRKIASLKAFMKYLECEDKIDFSPFNKIRLRIPIPKDLPRTIDLVEITLILESLYKKGRNTKTKIQKFEAIRNIAIIELLLNTGLRVSELCDIKNKDFDINYDLVMVQGKGKRQRILPLTNPDLRKAIQKYKDISQSKNQYFFLNRLGKRISPQSIRNIIKNNTGSLDPNKNITPHYFRHSFATILLEQNTDIRYIQQFLGHSTISTTEIYTKVSESKKRQILTLNSPRNLIRLSE